MNQIFVVYFLAKSLTYSEIENWPSVFLLQPQIYQEDMMRSLLQNSLHVFSAISGTSTDLGWPPSTTPTLMYNLSFRIKDLKRVIMADLCFMDALLCLPNKYSERMPLGYLLHRYWMCSRALGCTNKAPAAVLLKNVLQHVRFRWAMLGCTFFSLGNKPQAFLCFRGITVKAI